MELNWLREVHKSFTFTIEINSPHKCMEGVRNLNNFKTIRKAIIWSIDVKLISMQMLCILKEEHSLLSDP